MNRNETVCGHCRGTGSVTIVVETYFDDVLGFDDETEEETCDGCDGEGVVWAE